MALLLATAAMGQPREERKNRFADPFFQVSAALPNCPEPVGPRITVQEQRVQAHHRAERGTTCWLQGQCERPNAYEYDQVIAEALLKRWASEAPEAQSSLWVTVQGRTVYFEGCVLKPEAVARLESFARSLPHVLQAVAMVSTPAQPKPPYQVWASPSAHH